MKLFYETEKCAVAHFLFARPVNKPCGKLLKNLLFAVNANIYTWCTNAHFRTKLKFDIKCTT